MQNEKEMDAFVQAITGVGSFENGQFLEYAEKKAIENYREWYRMSNLIHKCESEYKKYYKAYQLAGGRPIREIETGSVLTGQPEIRNFQSFQEQPKPRQINGDERHSRQRRLGVSLEEFALFFNTVYQEFGEYPSSSVISTYYDCDMALPSRWRKKAVEAGLIKDVGYVRSSDDLLGRIIEKLGPFKMGGAA
jgi:hypothetical protein